MAQHNHGKQGVTNKGKDNEEEKKKIGDLG